MRLLIVCGVCVLLFCVNIEAYKNKNEKQFWELWEKDDGPKSSNDPDKDIFLDEEEGSGFDDDEDPDHSYDPTHEDDEDFPHSGDGEPDDDATGDRVVKEKDRPAGPSDDDDDDIYEESGSGVYEEQEVEVVDVIHKENAENTEATPRPKPLSACEQLRSTAFNGYIPECDQFGEFKKKQCAVDVNGSGSKMCWCVEADGKRVPGTMMNQSDSSMATPEEPDCDFGSNLPGCVFQLVQHGQNLLGAHKPRCDLHGNWEPTQCFGSQCWCVDELGNQKLTTVTDLPDMPDCDLKVTNKPEVTTKKPVKLPKPSGGYTVSTNNKNVVVTVSGNKDFETNEEELNNGNYAPIESTQPILNQPGMLAAIIAGGVITLLLIVLLVMFIVYRMRKKDEGSYPLDEQKYQNYSYAKAPDKEFYA